MADKKYLSKIVKGSDTLYIKDAEAQAAIADIESAIAGGLVYIGISETALTDLSTTSPVTTDKGVYTSGTPTGSQKELKEGMVAVYNKKEFIWSNAKWREFGDQSDLGALAFKDSASATYTPAGSNAASAVTFTGQTDGDFVTGYNNDGVAPSFTEGAFSQGTLPSFTEGAFTPASLSEGFYTAGTAPSLGNATTGTFVTGYNNDAVAPSLGNATTGSFVTGYNDDAVAPSLGAATTGSFNTDAEKSSYDENSETLTLSAASTAAAVTAQGTFSAGSAATLATASAVTAQGTFNAGSAATLATASAVTAQGTFSAGTMTALDLSKFDGGSKTADTWSAGTLPTKAADTFNAGSAATLATAKAITAVGTGEAAAQTFTGTEATITVS